MGRERGVATATEANEAEDYSSWVIVDCKEAVVPPCRPLQTRPCHLAGVVEELLLAFKLERAFGNVLNYRSQDPTSFSRLNGRVRALLKTYSQTNDGDWRSKAQWGDCGYLRHLLYGDETFELMLLCWKPGQTSRVHNHADSHCWLAVLAGQVAENQYQREEENQTGEERQQQTTTTCGIQLVATTSRTLKVGRVAYINDGIALHSVGCPATEPTVIAGYTDPTGLACTLHLYSPPIRRVKAFEAGQVTECVPGFFSRHSVYAA